MAQRVLGGSLSGLRPWERSRVRRESRVMKGGSSPARTARTLQTHRVECHAKFGCFQRITMQMLAVMTALIPQSADESLLWEQEARLRAEEAASDAFLAALLKEAEAIKDVGVVSEPSTP